MILELDEVEKAEWDAIKGKGKHDRQADLRAKWMAREKMLQEEYFQITSYETVGRTEGRMLPLQVIIQKDGGARNPENVKAALNYVFKAIVMGGDWVGMNSMTGRVEFLYIKKTRIECFKEKWEQRCSFRGHHGQTGVALPSSGSASVPTNL